MSLSSFFSSFLNVVHADAEEKEEVAEATQAEEVAQPEEEAEEPEDVSETPEFNSLPCLHFFSSVSSSNS